ncbi:MAG: anthranilate synthase component I family protein, partial [Bacteroidales bacterium]|nr:anthranilate synthase component I family protein [Bacteroidales bacterium]
MRESITFQIASPDEFKTKLLFWANQFSRFSFLDSNNYYNNKSGDFFFHSFNTIVAVDPIIELKTNRPDNFNNLKIFLEREKDWAFGHLGYDLKNELENLGSHNFDGIGFSVMDFFIPKYIFKIERNNVIILYKENYISKTGILNAIEEIQGWEIPENININEIKPEPRIQKSEYLRIVKKILEEIQYGNIYEMNFCNEFFSENQTINPVWTYINLQHISPAPFSAFYKSGNKFLISASPERFLKKTGDKIISQPIKGTIHRGKDKAEDNILADYLKKNAKEKAENTMIVDLVRNDLSKFAKKGSVKVDEFCGIYSFSHVHQMISTISAELEAGTHSVDAIKAAFPMGSMTGAPKVKAMELIEKFEKTKRGLYSGSVGYFTPDGNFDFNVIIRSILYNNANRYLSFITGSAITANSIPEMEYNECLLKAKAMQECL